MILTGKVIRGIGTAKMWVNKIQNIFEEKLKIKLFPGTLNIDIDTNYNVKPDLIIKPNEFGGTQNVLVQNCKIKCNNFEDVYNAFIVRAEKNEQAKGDHNKNIIEIVTDVNLREKYNLKDNDVVSIEIFVTTQT